MLVEKRLNGEIIEHGDISASVLFDEHDTHLCWDCANAYPSKCEKIADLRKKDIAEYDFIEKGYQTVINDVITKFIVLHCSNFKKDKEKTPEERSVALAEMRKAMDSILEYYYDTETPEEALAARSKMRARGVKMRLLKREKHF